MCCGVKNRVAKMSEVIYQDYLGETPYYVKTLTVDDLTDILALQQEVMDALPNKEQLQPLTSEEFLFILKGNGLMIGAFADQRLIAFRALLIPEMDDEGLGEDIGLTGEELKQILYQEITNVHPKYRGHSLQRKLANCIMKQIDQSKFKYILATVMPYNIPSLKDKFDQGMRIEELKEKFGGKIRYIFAKRLQGEALLEEESHFLSMGDFEGQRALLHKGYVGISLKQQDDDWFVEYKKVMK